jgi:pimeloyl-ACP methyl ester carboxylesterase
LNSLKRQTIATTYGNIAVYQVGEGEPLVFLAGYSMPFPLADYYKIIERLSEKYSVTLIDLMGYGNSDISGSKWSFHKNLSVINEIIIALKLNDSITFCGHSLGGNYALVYASYHPETVKKIILLDTYPYLNEFFISINKATFFFFGLFVKNRRNISTERISKLMKYGDIEGALPPGIVSELTEISKRRFLNQNVLDELRDVPEVIRRAFKRKNIAVPVLAFCRKLTVGSVRRLRRNSFNNIEIVLLTKTTHNIHRDNIDEVAQKILYGF